MLTCQRRLPAGAGPGTPVLVLLHGRGADENDLLGLAPHLPERYALVTPRAPFPAAPWGYGPGWAWYRFLGDRAPDAASLSASLDAVGELLGALPDVLGFAPGDVVLGGFSQGGTTALGYALAARARQLEAAGGGDAGLSAVQRVAVLSGFLPEHPAVSPGLAGRGLRVFWGHGQRDGSIPFAWGEAGRAALRQAGAEVVARDYPIGHGISGQELADLGAWLEEG